MKTKHPFLDTLESYINNSLPQQPFLSNICKTGIEELKKHGIPHSKQEDWLYTNVEPLFENEWDLNPTGLTNVNVEEIFKCDVPDLDSHVILFFNGKFYPQHHPLPKGINLYSIEELKKTDPQLLEKYFFKAAPLYKPMNSINAILAKDGYFLHIEKGATPDKPIQIVNASIGNQPFFVNQHNIILAEENCSVQILSCDHTLSLTRFLNNHLTEIHLRKNASLELYNSQNANNQNSLFSSIFVHQQADSHFHSNIISLHGGLIRNELSISLLEPGAECHAYGLNLTDRKQHVDNVTQIHHYAPHCTSFQSYKGIYDNEASGAFSGRIIVHKGAQKTVAYQSNRNILLTPLAKVNSRPQLEIYADDVKCSHGATTGQLDPNALFYMQTRGIDKKEARMLLMYAFANEIISKIKVPPLSHRIEGLVNRRLRGELSQCANCVIHCG